MQTCKENARANIIAYTNDVNNFVQTRLGGEISWSDVITHKAYCLVKNAICVSSTYCHFTTPEMADVFEMDRTTHFDRLDSPLDGFPHQ